MKIAAAILAGLLTSACGGQVATPPKTSFAPATSVAVVTASPALSEPPRSPSPRTTPTAVPSPSPTEVAVDDCATLSVPQPDGDRDTNLALQEGWLGITYNDDGYGNAVRVTIEFLDQACIEHPVIGPIIDHVLPDALQDLDPDCTWFRSLLESGQLRVRGEPIRSDAVEGYLTRWCRASQS